MIRGAGRIALPMHLPRRLLLSLRRAEDISLFLSGFSLIVSWLLLAGDLWWYVARPGDDFFTPTGEN